MENIIRPSKMDHNIKEKDGLIDVSYGWKVKDKNQRIIVMAKGMKQKIEPNSVEEFIAEHYWGYTKINKDKTSSYEVKHPSWNQHLVTSYEIKVDFKENYGREFEKLNDQQPHSVFLFDGSPISVGNKLFLK